MNKLVSANSFLVIVITINVYLGKPNVDRLFHV